MNIPNYSGAGVYRIKIGDACYIGSAVNVRKRLMQHKRDAAAHREPVALQAAFDSGACAHVDILAKLRDNATRWDLLQAERQAIVDHMPALNAAPVAAFDEVAWIEAEEARIRQLEQQLARRRERLDRTKSRYFSPLGGGKHGRRAKDTRKET